MSTCLIRELTPGRTVITKCGGTVRKDEATVWSQDVTCPACLDGRRRPTEDEEYRASIAALAPLTTRPS